MTGATVLGGTAPPLADPAPLAARRLAPPLASAAATDALDWLAEAARRFEQPCREKLRDVERS